VVATTPALALIAGFAGGYAGSALENNNTAADSSLSRLNTGAPESSPLHALAARFSEWRYALRQRDPRRARQLLRDLRAHRPSDGEP
jgi:hypothetical protein